jgi:hypothetical protein
MSCPAAACRAGPAGRDAQSHNQQQQQQQHKKGNYFRKFLGSRIPEASPDMQHAPEAKKRRGQYCLQPLVAEV